jgi:hypothetical protein
MRRLQIGRGKGTAQTMVGDHLIHPSEAIASRSSWHRSLAGPDAAVIASGGEGGHRGLAPRPRIGAI